MKFTVISSEPRTWNDKPFKVADLRGEAGETYEDISFWQRLDQIIAGKEIEGDIQVDGHKKRFAWPRKQAFGRSPEDQAKTEKRIAFSWATNCAIQVLGNVDDTDPEMYQGRLRRWRIWFLNELNTSEK